MKASEVHALGDQDLVQALKDAREEAFNLRFRHATGGSTTPRVSAARAAIWPG